VIDRIKGWLADFPTTSLRIVVTVGCVIGTSFVAFYCFVRAIPLDESNFDSWLMFLAVMAGIDTAHWAVKRTTAWKPETTTQVTTTTAATPVSTTTTTTAATTVAKAPTAAPVADDIGDPENDPNHDMPGVM
jgi:hypothetical protein